MVQAVARFCYRKRWLVVLIWVVMLAGFTFWARQAGNGFSTSFVLKGADSQAAYDVLEQRFPSQAGGTGDIVFKADNGIRDQAARSDMDKLFADVSKVDHVAVVVSPYSAQGLAQVGPDGKIAYATIVFDERIDNLGNNVFKRIQDLAAGANRDGLQVDLGGDAFSTFKPKVTSESIGLGAAVIILLIAFGSLLAMGLPIITALFGLGIGVAIVELLAHVISLPDFSTQLATMIGIGVGIDYALLIVTRYRQGLHSKLDPEQAVVTAVNTAGRSVLFAGTTVVISLLGMVLIDISFIQGLGIGSAVVVAVTMFAALTLLPAVLGFAGHKIDALKIPGLGNEKENQHKFWWKWSRQVQHHPWPPLIIGVAIMLLFAVPFFSMRLGSSDASNRPTADTTRRAYDLKSEGFGIGSNGPLLLAAELGDANDATALGKLQTALQTTHGVAFVSSPRLNEKGTAAVMTVIPTTSPQDAATVDLIKKIREDVIPAAVQGSGAQVHVGGVTATFDDLAAKLQARLPVFIGTVLLLSFLLLMIVFRSVVLPVKAVLLNMLSIGAAYGVLVAVFQWGWGGHLLGVGNKGPIESFLPMMLFAILFGLSMDYEVFLLSRIKEEYDRSGKNGLAVADGLAHTARVITAAAAIMVTVFASFIVTDLRILKEFGLGLAIAVLLDATIVRLVIVPSIMEIMGDANWWWPKWLDWMPQLHIDGNEVIHDAASAEVHAVRKAATKKS